MKHVHLPSLRNDLRELVENQGIAGFWKFYSFLQFPSTFSLALGKISCKLVS